MAKPGDLSTIDFDALLERVANGEHLSALAVELKVSRQAVRGRLIDHPGYKEAIKDGQRMRLQRIRSQLEAVGLGTPPTRPRKRDYPVPEEYASAMDDYRSAHDLWADGAEVSTFELKRLDAAWRSESWVAERQHPDEWGPKGSLHLLAHFSLADALKAMAEADEAPAIEGEGNRMIELSAKEQ